jgi:hypothetical protein
MRGGWIGTLLLATLLLAPAAEAARDSVELLGVAAQVDRRGRLLSNEVTGTIRFVLESRKSRVIQLFAVCPKPYPIAMKRVGRGAGTITLTGKVAANQPGGWYCTDLKFDAGWANGR